MYGTFWDQLDERQKALISIELWRISLARAEIHRLITGKFLTSDMMPSQAIVDLAQQGPDAYKAGITEDSDPQQLKTITALVEQLVLNDPSEQIFAASAFAVAPGYGHAANDWPAK